MNERESTDQVPGKKAKKIYGLHLLANLSLKANQPNQSIRELEKQLRNPRTNRPPKPPVR